MFFVCNSSGTWQPAAVAMPVATARLPPLQTAADANNYTGLATLAPLAAASAWPPLC
jgi:hypothetical protein